MLPAFERGEGSGGSGDARPDVGQLWADVTALYSALSSHRQELGQERIATTMVVQEQQARLAALKDADEEIRKRLGVIRGRFKAEPERGKKHPSRTPIPAPSPGEWLSAKSGHAGQWGLADPQVRAFDTDLEEARASLQQAEGKTFGGGLRQKGTDALGRVAQRLSSLADAIGAASGQVSEAEQSRESASQAAAERSRDAFNPIASRAARSALGLATVLQPWSSAAWDSWSLDDETNLGLRLAYGGALIPNQDQRLGSNAGFGADLRIPWGFSLHDSWYLMHDGPSRTTAHSFVRSMMLRQLLSVAPGEVKFCVFDPVGLGQSAGELLDLAEYDADLIGGKVWLIVARPRSPADRVERPHRTGHPEVPSTIYQTIDEFNDAAGEVAEPYRMLILFDSPNGLTSESAARLKSIVANGPRCGVFTLMAVDASVQAPYGVDMTQLSTSMRKLNLQGAFSDNLDGYQLEASFEHDVLPERTEVAKRIIDSVGRASVYRTEAAVTFDKVFEMYGNVAARGLRPELGDAATRTKPGDPKTWWRDNSTRGLFAPVGQKGARDVAVLGFDSSYDAGALLVGRPGSGKSTLRDTYVGGLTTLYGPDELELDLIDFKEGVEFKAYAEEKLPHAKVIAIESDREFGLSVLESLQAEITQRAELLRATGGRQAGMQALRETTGSKIPRILLVFDEFQVLFARNDKVGLAAADLLESRILQGGASVSTSSWALRALRVLMHSGPMSRNCFPYESCSPRPSRMPTRCSANGNNA